MKRPFAFIVFSLFWGFFLTAAPSLATYGGANLGYIDSVTVNDREFDHFDEQQIVFYPEDLQEGYVVLRGLLESEQQTIKVSDLQVEITLDGGQTWSPATGAEIWTFRFRPILEKTYNIALRVVKKNLNNFDLAPLKPIPMELRPAITSLKPSRWLPGETYNVVGQGLLLDNVEDIFFGEGVDVTDLQHDGDKKLSFSVSIDQKTPPSVRFAVVNQRGRHETTPARCWILKPPPKFNKVPPLVWEIDKEIKLRQGAIYLQTPEWKFSGEMAGNNHPVPALNDATILTWKEETPGLADQFEIRFFTPGGKLVSKKVVNLKAPATYTTTFKPGSQFVAALFHQLAALKKQPVSSVAAAVNTLAGPPAATIGSSQLVLQAPVYSADNILSAPINGTPLSPLEQYLHNNKSSIDLLWQVVGLKEVVEQEKTPQDTQNSQGSAGIGAEQYNGGQQLSLESEEKKAIEGALESAKIIKTKMVEIAISKKWPLHLADLSPTGMVCDAGNQFELDTINWSHPGGKNPGDLLHYPGDSLTIGGNFSLQSSPWAISAQTTYAGGDVVSDASYQFNNVIVDWGDGSWTQLNAAAVESSLPGWSNADTMSFNETHQYAYPGAFKVRLYVVPQDQMGQIEAIVAAHSTKDQTGSATGKFMLHLGETEISEDPGSRIFMLYCNPLDVTIVQDTAATGPLNLDSITMTSFSSDANGEIALQSKKLQKTKGIQQLQVPGKKELAVNPTTLSFSEKKPSQIITSLGEDTRVSSCDGGLWAKGVLKYFGQGYARIQWLVDDIVIDSRDIKIGPSQLRMDLGADPESWGAPLLSEFVIDSPRLPISDLSLHRVRLSAVVIPDPTWSVVNAVALKSSFKQFNNHASQKGGRQTPLTLNAQGIKGLKPAFIPMTGGSLKGKSWSKQSDQLISTLKKVTGKFTLKPTKSMFAPPYSVISEVKRYLVVKNSGDQICQMSFPTEEGNFEITALKNLNNQNGIFSGKGLLIYKLADGGPASSSEHYIPIHFTNWQVSESATVENGHLNVALDETIDALPGMKATVNTMVGDAGQHISATMKVAMKDPTLRLMGSEKPQQWNGISAVLSPYGDWYASGLKLERSLIGWSMSSIESDDVRLDLSHKEGDSPICAGSGAAWVGIHLGAATLHPYAFDLADISLPVSDWGITSAGLCGKGESDDFSHPFGQGEIGWDKLTINVSQGNVYASYDNFHVDMAWPKLRISSPKATFNYSPGSQINVQLGFNQFPTVTEHYDYLDMKVTAKGFSHTASGWGLLTDTEMTFRDLRGKLFADQVNVNDLLFLINDFVEYSGGAVPLNIKGQVGGADELISSLLITPGDQHSPHKLLFDFTTEFSMEGMGRAKEPIHILYGIQKNSGESATSTKPKFPAQIIIESQFPETNSAAKNRFVIQYGATAVAGSDSSGSNCGRNTFNGHINTQLFGGGPYIEGTFRFGTISGEKFWLGFLKGDNLGIPIFTGVDLEMIQGGLAYNFEHDAFNHEGGYNACPVAGKGLLFSSGLGLSFGDSGAIRADGVLTIQPSDSFYQMDLRALLFNVADLRGRIRYWNTSFDGEIWGTASLMNDNIMISAPEHSCGIHIDPNAWFFHMGSPELPVTGHVATLLTGETYLTLQPGSFIVSIGANYSYDKTFAGFGFRGSLSVNGRFSLLNNPLRFDGEVNGHADGTFVNPVKNIDVGLDARVWAGCCSPVKYGFGFSTSCCCVSGGLDIKVLPSTHISGHAGCSCCPW